MLWHCSHSASVYLLESSEQFGYGCGSAFQGTEVPKSKTNRHKDNLQASCVQLLAPFLSGGPQLLGLMPTIQFLVTIQAKGLCLTYPLAGRPCPTQASCSMRALTVCSVFSQGPTKLYSLLLTPSSRPNIQHRWKGLVGAPFSSLTPYLPTWGLYTPSL